MVLRYGMRNGCVTSKTELGEQVNLIARNFPLLYLSPD